MPGVRLGMAPRDVRDRFDGGGEGVWQMKVGGGAGASDDTVLEWSASTEKSRATRARFEFREPVAASHVDLTPKTVSLRAPEAGGTEVTILARDCPTHHDEAEALAAKAGAGH